MPYDKEQNIMKYLKNINFLTLFLFSLIGVMIVLFVYVYNTYSFGKKHNNINDVVDKMLLLDKSFNAFLLNQRKVIDLDYITQDLRKFQSIISKIQNDGTYVEFDRSMVL